jgi:hypothetical protein
MLAVDRREQAAVPADGLGRSEKQKAVLAQGVVEQRQEPGLQIRSQVNQDVATGDQIEARERRIGDHTLDGEHAHGTQALGHAVEPVLAHEEALDPLARHVRERRRGIQTRTRARERGLVDVSGEDLRLQGVLPLLQLLEEQDPDGVRFFSGAAARDPHPDPLAR